MVLKIKKMVLGIVAFSLISACSDNDGLTEFQRASADFKTQIGGNIDAAQLWKTTVVLNVNVNTDSPTEILAYSVGTSETILFDRKEIATNGAVQLTVPQGYGNQIMLSYSNGIKRFSKTISLTGIPKQEIDISILSQTSNLVSMSTSRVSSTSTLYGSDIVHNIGYINMDVEEVLSVLSNIQEGVSAELKDVDINYELISNGPFNVSMLYGFTGCYDSRILGYYYHSPGTYADLTFVDLVDTHSYDYLNGEAKVQYQIDGETTKWYDANYDYRDGFEPPYTSVTDRLGDDSYNIDFVINRYGSRLTAIRGLSYLIDVPVGYRIGFYLKRPGIVNSIQKASMISKGIPSSVLPETFEETNFSAMVLNCDGKHRSFYKTNNSFTFMGMEDAGASGDMDCNDVIFGVCALLEKELPTLATPEIDAMNMSYTQMPWTIAFEDVGRNADFDFNDAVIRIIPDYDKKTAEVYACAAGSENPIYLYYDGPNGDTQLCEIHEALGGGTFINTTSSMAITAPRLIATVEWPIDYSIANDANRFYCQVKRGNCEDCTDIISLNDEPGKMPQAIMVAGKWNWPKEGYHISTVYSNYADWCKDETKMSYWNWYSYPKADTYVSE